MYRPSKQLIVLLVILIVSCLACCLVAVYIPRLIQLTSAEAAVAECQAQVETVVITETVEVPVVTVVVEWEFSTFPVYISSCTAATATAPVVPIVSSAEPTLDSADSPRPTLDPADSPKPTAQPTDSPTAEPTPTVESTFCVLHKEDGQPDNLLGLPTRKAYNKHIAHGDAPASGCVHMGNNVSK